MMIDFTRMVNSTLHWLGLDQEADPPPPGPRRHESEVHLSGRERPAAALDSGMTARSSRLFGESPSPDRGSRSDSNQDGSLNWFLSVPMIAAAAIFGMIPVAMAIGRNNGDGNGSDSNERSEGPAASERQETASPDAEGRATSREMDPQLRGLLRGLAESIRDGSFSRAVEAETNGLRHPSESLIQSYAEGASIPSDVRTHLVLCQTCGLEFSQQRLLRNAQSTTGLPQSSVESSNASMVERFRDVLGPELADQAEELRQVVVEHWSELSQAERTEYERASSVSNPSVVSDGFGIPEIVILSHIEALRNRVPGERMAEVHARAVERLRDPQSRQILERSLREAREVARTGRR